MQSKKISIDDWKKYFPFENIRPEQEKAINFILNSFINENKKFCICEMGTGTGKSATGITVARYLNSKINKSTDKTGTYVLTTQKILQDQYVDDFGPTKKNLLRTIKSSSNYSCAFYKDQTCGESRRLLNQLSKNVINDSEFHKQCKNNCLYKQDKERFINSPISITNFSYFLAETMYAGKLEPRETLIIDECHNIELELSKFIEVTFSEKFAKDILKCKLPILKGNQEGYIDIVFNWVKKIYKPTLSKYIDKIKKTLEDQISNNIEHSKLLENSKQHDMLDKHICKINRFIQKFDKDNWILNVIETNSKYKKFEFKPIEISSYCQDLLYKFGNYTLLLSATIIDKNIFCKSIGLDASAISYIRIPSPFSVKNRPVHYLPVGKMSLSHIDKTLPKMLEAILLLLEQHKNEKGVIHCTNYKIANYLQEKLNLPRILTHNSENRDLVLQQHISSLDPTVLLSPSMSEGVNLSDNSSRFQIICKIPFPYLGDKVIQKRNSKDPGWYSFQTVKTIVQSLGRSIRNQNDYAVSYILDEDWDFFYRKNKHLFSEDFIESLQSY